MTKNNANLEDWEKNIQVFSWNLKKIIFILIDEFLTEAINKINFQIYFQRTIDYNKTFKDSDDLMDLCRFSKSNDHSIKRSNYCHIDKENRHSTDDCIYNGLNKKFQNQSNKGENKLFDQKKKKRKLRKSKRNNNKIKGKSFNAIEYRKNPSDEEVSFGELKAMYDKSFDHIETIGKSKWSEPSWKSNKALYIINYWPTRR